jgi:hypothetical protein
MATNSNVTEQFIKIVGGVEELVRLASLNIKTTEPVENDSYSMPDDEDDSDSIPDLEQSENSFQNETKEVPKYSPRSYHYNNDDKYKGIDMIGLTTYISGIFMNDDICFVNEWFRKVMIDKEYVFDAMTTQDVFNIIKKVIPNIDSNFEKYGFRDGLNGKFLHKKFGLLCKSLYLSENAILSLAYELIYLYKGVNKEKVMELLPTDSSIDINKWFGEAIGPGKNDFDDLSTVEFQKLLNKVFPNNNHRSTVYKNGINGLYVRKHFGDTCELLRLTTPAVSSLAYYIISEYKSN